MGNSKDDKQHEKKRDSVLEKMLNAPPEPHKPKKDMRKERTVTIRLDAHELLSLIDSVNRSLEVIDGPINLGNFFDEIISLKANQGSAVANELIVILEPSNRLRRYLAAVTGDVDSRVV